MTALGCAPPTRANFRDEPRRFGIHFCSSIRIIWPSILCSGGESVFKASTQGWAPPSFPRLPRRAAGGLSGINCSVRSRVKPGQAPPSIQGRAHLDILKRTMSSPAQVRSRSPSHSPTLAQPSPTMMSTLPPVFSPESSPPLDESRRTHYLPLVSPMLTDDDRSFRLDRRRESTPTLQKSGVSSYFADLRKRRRTSDSPSSSSCSSSRQNAVFLQQKGRKQNARFSELPASIAQPILRAMESQTSGSSSTLTLPTVADHIAARKRTLSMPITGASEDGISDSTRRLELSKRRASVRSRQLALLASQARLARSGATSVNTALRAERAVDGAVKRAVEDAQASRSAIQDEAGKGEGRIEEEDADANSEEERFGVDLHDHTTPWSHALSTPQFANAFFSSASEVAHDWANGFYAFEREWAGDALRKERGRLRKDSSACKRRREDGNGERQSVSPKRTASQPVTREVSPSLLPVRLPAASVTSSHASLAAAGKRLSLSLPTRGRLKNNTDVVDREDEPGGKLVDVLSNFASLIEQRQEGCHGLERLAQDAKRLSTVHLPSVGSSLPRKQEVAEQDVDDDDEGGGGISAEETEHAEMDEVDPA